MIRILLGIVILFVAVGRVEAQDPTVAPLMRLLASGRLPAQRQPQVLEMICKRGGPEELQAVFDLVQKPDALPPALRTHVLGWLTEAAQTRKMKPSGDMSGIGKVVTLTPEGKNAEFVLAAVKLAAEWKVAAASEELSSLAMNNQTSDKLRRAAIEGLATLGDLAAIKTLDSLMTDRNPLAIRMMATAGMARLDLSRAAAGAAHALADATPTDDPDTMLNAFFLLKDGATKLAAELEKVQLKPDVAKRALRFMYAVGHSDAELSNLLSQRAGIAVDTVPPTQEEAMKIAEQVAKHGDAVRGEQIFRRADVSCLNCHAIHRAGGQVGPDLSNVGRISPVDYIVTSVLNPNLAIKEAYVTRIIETTDGKLVQGIAVDRDAVRVILKTADGRTITIPTADIDTEEEGRSLMPQGLTKFLTQQEFYDLAKFVSELGKESGNYTAPNPPSIQRWRVLTALNTELLTGIPNVEQVREYILDTPADDWRSAYAMVSGQLPLAEIFSRQPMQPAYLLGEIDVAVAGNVTFTVESEEAVQAWVDAAPRDAQSPFTVNLTAGRHTIVLRIAQAQHEHSIVRVTVSRPNESTAQFDIVAGQ